MLKISLTLTFLSLFTLQAMAAEFQPPATRSGKLTEEVHNIKLNDDYRWLEDKKDPSVIDWTQKQHDSTLNYFNQNYREIADLKEEFTAYIDRDIEGPVRLAGSRQFFSMKKKGELQYKLYTKIDGKDVLLFDPVTLDPSGKTAISSLQYTFDGSKVAVGVQYKGDEISTYHILDTKTGKSVSEPVSGLRGFLWNKDGEHAYITVGTKEMLEQQIPLKTYIHKTGTDRAKDKFLFSPKDAKDFSYIYDSKKSDISFIIDGDFYTNSIKIKKTASDEKETLIYENHGFKASPYAVDDKIYIMTNHKAPNFKLMVADKNKPEFANWKELYPEKDTVLESFEVTPDYLLIVDKKDLISRISAFTHEGKLLREVKLPEMGSVDYVEYNEETNQLFVGMSSFTAPYKIYTINPKSLDNWKLFYQSKVPVDTSQVETEIKFIPSKDGTKVPVFIHYKKGMKPDGTNPVLLYGYGGFNIGIKPGFVGLMASFINRGGIYVNAGIRGGDEYGEKWHLDGMMHKKQNTFDDFISIAEYLIDNKYTSKERLAVMGGSNGGLLIGSVITQRPDLFKAAICSVPLLDMIRYHKFLIARYWIPEYGDPDKKEDFEYLLTYSPYHNVKKGTNHPTTMVIAGEHDTRVDPLHAKKFVAALQNNKGQDNPIFLYMDFDSGHGSGKSTEQVIEDQYIKWKFLMNELGMN